MTDECTIVTAYYEFPQKKHHSSWYDYWIKNYLQNVNSYMVIFTDEKSSDKLLELRKNFIDKTKIIVLPVTEFYTYKFIDYWNKDHARS